MTGEIEQKSAESKARKRADSATWTAKALFLAARRLWVEGVVGLACAAECLGQSAEAGVVSPGVLWCAWGVQDTRRSECIGACV
eukprot:266606-Rhodomonas_salina.3